METPAEPKTPEQIQHESNKIVREALAFAHYKLGVTPILIEEANTVAQSRGVLEAMCVDLQKKIELVEPPILKTESQKGPYVMEVPAPISPVQ